MRNAKIGLWRIVVLTLAISLSASAQRAKSKALPKGAFAKNVEVAGFTDLNGHFPFKISIHPMNARWYMYADVQDAFGQHPVSDVCQRPCADL